MDNLLGESHQFGRKEIIQYRENRENIIQSVEIDLTEIPDQSRQNIESKITYLKHINTEHKVILIYSFCLTFLFPRQHQESIVESVEL